MLPNVATYNPRGQQTINGNTGNFFFNPLAFSNSRLLALDQIASTDAAMLNGMYTEGTLGRNAIRGPGLINMDLALSKHLKFYEKVDAELRLDAFNVFNHVNFGNPNTNIFQRWIFGRVGQPHQGPRVVQIALHFRF